MNRRQILAGLLMFAAAAPSFAAGESSAVTVVKILNFSCPVCRASETQDSAISSAAEATAGQLVFAPIPSEAGEYAREKVYFASRKQGRRVEDRVRESLYRGAQDVNMPFMNITQVVEWLKDDLADIDVDWRRLAHDANSPEAMNSLARAAALAQQAGAQALPSYVLVQNNRPAATLDVKSIPGGNLLNLREELLKRIQQLATPTHTK